MLSMTSVNQDAEFISKTCCRTGKQENLKYQCETAESKARIEVCIDRRCKARKEASNKTLSSSSTSYS